MPDNEWKIVVPHDDDDRVHIIPGPGFSTEWLSDGSMRYRSWDAEGNLVRDETSPPDEGNAWGEAIFGRSIWKLTRSFGRGR